MDLLKLHNKWVSITTKNNRYCGKVIKYISKTGNDYIILNYCKKDDTPSIIKI